MLDGASGLLFDHACLLFDDTESIHAYHLWASLGRTVGKLGMNYLVCFQKLGVFKLAGSPDLEFHYFPNLY